MKLQHILITLLLFSSTLFSQQKKIDSLKSILKNNLEITTVVNTNINLGKLFNNKNTDSAMLFFRKALLISKKNNLTKYKARAYNNIAASFIMKGKLDSSEVYFNKVKNMLPNITDYNATVSYYGDRGILDYYKGDLQKAGENFEKALNIAIKEKNIQDIIRYSNNFALVLSKTGQSNKAIKIYYKALKSAEEEKDSAHIGMLLNNIGNIYEDLNESEKAVEIYKKSLEIKKRNGSYISLITAYFNVANVQLKLSKKTNDSLLLLIAEKNYDTVISLSKEKKYGNGNLMGLAGLGKVAIERKDFSKSKKHYQQLLKNATKSKNTPYINEAHLSLGYIEVEKKRYSSAKKHLLIVKDFIEKSGSSIQKKQLYHNLGSIYYYQKQYKKAYKNLTKEREVDESLNSEEIKDKISNYEVKYETAKKAIKIAQQKEELVSKELIVKKKSFQATLLAGLLLLLGIISFGFYKKNQLKRQQLQKEIDLKDALSKIKTQNRLQEQRLRISRDLHDNIGSQLTFIISSVDNLKYVTKDASEILKNKLSTISSFTADTIFQLRDTIWAMNKNEITFDDLHTRILSFIEKAKEATNNTTFSITNSIEKPISLSSIQGMNIFRVLQEAVNNAIKYANASEISINASVENNQLSIIIKDTGDGFELTTTSLGNGLTNMQKRINEINGQIFISSKPTIGTEIKINCTL